MRLLEVGHELLFALLTKDRHVPKPWEQRPGALGEGGMRQNVEERWPPAPEGTGGRSGWHRPAVAILSVATWWLLASLSPRCSLNIFFKGQMLPLQRLRGWDPGPHLPGRRWVLAVVNLSRRSALPVALFLLSASCESRPPLLGRCGGWM